MSLGAWSFQSQPFYLPIGPFGHCCYDTNEVLLGDAKHGNYYSPIVRPLTLSGRENADGLSAYADRMITVFLDSAINTSSRGMLISNSPVLLSTLQSGAESLDLPRHDIETFRALEKWMYERFIDEVRDNGDAIGLMQAYDLAYALGMDTACTELSQRISTFFPTNRLTVPVINETAHIPPSCILRDYLLSRLLSGLEGLLDVKKLRNMTDVEGSLWQEPCVAQALAGITLKKQLKHPTQTVCKRARNRLAKRYVDELMSPAQRGKEYARQVIARAATLLGMDAAALVARDFRPHGVIHDEWEMESWVDEWNAQNAKGAWAVEEDSGRDEDDCDEKGA